MLCYAVTIHKVQGQQFPTALVNFNLCKKKSFNAGQMYVLLSRIESLNWLYISGNITKNAIRPDKKALIEYERLRSESMMPPIERFTSLPTNFIFGNLNIRSFQSHLKDIKSDNVLMHFYLLLFTETKMKDTTDVLNLKDFHIYLFNDNIDDSKSLAVFYRQNLHFE